MSENSKGRYYWIDHPSFHVDPIYVADPDHWTTDDLVELRRLKDLAKGSGGKVISSRLDPQRKDNVSRS